MKTLLEDKRTIRSINDNISQHSYIVGKNGITSIKIYGEPGHMAMIPWCAIYKGDILWRRTDLNCKDVTYYEEPWEIVEEGDLPF